MINLIFYVAIFYIAQLLLPMTMSLTKVPFVNYSYVGGDISNETNLSLRIKLARDNFVQTLPIFFVFSILSIIQGVESSNLLLGYLWLLIRVLYLVGALFNVYTIPHLRPLVWSPSIVILIMMGVNLTS
jgi:uncharacterized MAPEG superfamily protein|tara:strand:- start:588 stop:974 length:387 start_codon:yes stop_codon:yes gene_type:complete